MVILRCVGPEAFFREKVVLPHEQFVWSCPTESRVDLWSYGLGGPELLEGSRTDVSDWVTPISMLRDAFFDCRSEVEPVS